MEQNTKKIEVKIKSPMGWIKVYADLTEKETTFTGEARLMGFTVELTDCAKKGNHYSFVASPTLPFGVLRVEIEADIAENGQVTGIANAPRHKPMEIIGQVV